MKNVEKIIWVIALVAVIVLIGVVGYGYYKKAIFKAENPGQIIQDLRAL